MFSMNPSLVCTMALTMALSAPFSALAADPPSVSPKEQMHLDMIALARQMHDLRPQMASNEAAAAVYEQLQAAYKRMSDELGGDDPGRSLPSREGDKHGGVAAMGGTPLDEGGIAGTLATPPGCVTESNVFGNATDFPINNNATTTATVIVSGLEGRVWYVEPQFDIAHTFCADLDITLTSPNGTTITISTDNGDTHNNVFLGTEWRDHANPFGPVPYFTNNGLATDHNYQNGVLASPLVPEEPLHAFAGEDPNGVWTVRIFDDTLGDTGTLFGWDMFVYTTSDPTNRTTRTFTNIAAAAIPDATGLPSLLARSIDVTGMGGYLCDVQVRLNVTHPFNEDLDITLTSPTNRVITLTSDNGFTNDNGFAGTTFDDSADPGTLGVNTPSDGFFVNLVARNLLTPEESFASLRGTPANGTWSLRISDDTTGNVGTFHSVSLILTTCSCEESCSGDLNGDGLANVDDLLGVINGWGACP